VTPDCCGIIIADFENKIFLCIANNRGWLLQARPKVRNYLKLLGTAWQQEEKQCKQIWHFVTAVKKEKHDSLI